MGIPLPHGGRLVDREMPKAERERRLAEARELPRLKPGIDLLHDADKIGVGAYSPLEGFMDSATVASVLDRGRLPNGLPWPIPIVLAPTGPENERVLASIRPGEDVLLVDAADRPHSLLRVEESYRLDRARLAEGTFGTKDTTHPNVADIYAGGERALAGTISVLQRLELPTGPYEMTPAATRAEFERRGWKNVAAYQCRNPPHTAHEYLQRVTLDREDVDGLFIQPVVGRLKKGDYRPPVILECYRALVDNYYPKNRVLLGSLTVTMRYAGPKAALFFAIVRKNFGCSFYIVGRDQAGVGKFYDPYACHRIFDEYDIGITPLRYSETFFCRRCGWMASPKTCAHPPSERVDTSQTRIRAALKAGTAPPMEILRPEVYEILRRGDVVNEE